MARILVVGAGAFGLAGALALRERGHAVTLIDPGPIPHPDASSTDISKAVRMDYGADAHYVDLMQATFAGWEEWNRAAGEALYREEGFLLLSRSPMERGGFEHDGFALLTARGFALERVDERVLRERFPEWADTGYVDGYFNPRAGWALSGRVVAWLAERARAAGVEVREGVRFARLLTAERVAGVATADGEELRADTVVFATGAWTPHLLPHLSDVMATVAQPVVHLRVKDPERWRSPRFPLWAADIARTGWYGFPALADGTLKIGHHGPGRRVDPHAPRGVTDEERERALAFVARTFPDLAGAPVIKERACLYCDTRDGDFWIDRDPELPGLVVAAGGSGHGFKFAPVVGGWIASVVEGRDDPALARFRRRVPNPARRESARFPGDA